MRMRARSLAAIALAVLTLGVAGCDKKPSPDGASGTAGSASVTRAPSAVQAHPGCNLTTPGGNLLPKLGLGTLSLAVAKGKALVVDTQEGIEKPRADRILLGPEGVPEGEAEAIDDLLPKGQSAITFASAMAFQDDLTSLAFAYGARPPSAAQCAEGVVMMKALGVTGARREVTHACRTTTLLRGAARHELGIAIVDDSGVADAWVIDRADTRLVHLETLDKADAKVVDGAVAAGATSLAAAWVVSSGTTRELHVARVGRAGEILGKMDVLDKQNVGSVTMAFEADTLHIVWSSFQPDRNRSVLKWTKWPASGTPQAAQTIGTGVLSATQPSLAFADGRFMLAWTEGDAIRVGASRAGIAGLSGLATTSAKGGPASSAVVGLEHDAMFVAWREAGPNAGVRASTLKCLE